MIDDTGRREVTKEVLTSDDPAGWYECESLLAPGISRVVWWDGECFTHEKGGSPVLWEHANFRGPLVVATQPAPGIERPDAPGVWFRDGEAYLVFADATNEIEMLFAANGLQMANGELCQEWVSDLPPGNWRRAVPAAYPRLIESGPLPEGHLYVAFPKPGRGVRHPVALDRGADNPNHDEFDIFDYGPLPQKGGE